MQLWPIVWTVLASWTPPPLHGWRRFLLRAFGATIDHGARIYGTARITHPHNLIMGRYAAIGWNVTIDNPARLILEDYASISQFSIVEATREVCIKRNAWVASKAYVGPGVTVEEGVVIGACGVATGALEPWTVYGGDPLLRIRARKYFER